MEKKADFVVTAESTFSSRPSTPGPQTQRWTPPTWLSRLNPRRRQIPPIPEIRSACPESSAGFFSRLTFQWMTPIMRTGHRRPLELKDIWLVNPDREVGVMAERFHGHMSRNIDQAVKNPLLRAIHATFMKEFWIGGIWLLVASVCQTMSPFTLRYLIEFAQDAYVASIVQKQTSVSPDSPHGPAIGRGLGLVFTITILQIISSVGVNQFMYNGFIVGGQARGVLVMAIFEKSLRISSRAKAGGHATATGSSDPEKTGEPDAAERREHAEKLFRESDISTTGKLPPHSEQQSRDGKKRVDASPDDDQAWSNARIMNLMANDSSRIDQACGMCHLIWTSPIAILLSLAILLSNLKSSALAGFGLMVVCLPPLVMVMKAVETRRKAINRVTDSRMSLTQEILNSIRFVKFCAWERAFLQDLMSIRQRETSLTQGMLTMRNGLTAFSYSLPVFAAMLSFITYSLSGHELTSARVFSSLALFNALRLPFNILPMVIGQVIDAWASMTRIQDFLMAEEHQRMIVTESQLPHAIDVRAAGFVWEHNASASGHAEESVNLPAADAAGGEPFSIQDMNFTINRTELVAIIGPVGSGKSSLLSGMTGDMRMISGEVHLGGSRAFCPQHAWIQNATLQENILFGKTMDEAWYGQVVHACALQPDFDILPAGDKTEIGERGINLSGGQKQRINLARAIYSDREIILMDDPLSAVDAHVGRHIFEEAICGLLKDRCRVLATHQLHYLERCDRVIWIDQGRVKATGTFKDLFDNHDSFRELLTYVTQSGKTNDEHVKPSCTKHAAAEESISVVQLMQDEEHAASSVPWSLYGDYMRASGSVWNFGIPIANLLLLQGANITTSLWLTYWVSHRFDITRGEYVATYVGLAFLQLLFTFAFPWSLSILGTRSSRTLFDNAMKKILGAPTVFFDTTPLGRITNRFSNDVEVLDNNISDALRQYMFNLSMIVSVCTLFIVFFHWAGIALLPGLLMFLYVTAYYRSSAREIKRYEANLRSTMFARFSEAITGIPSIRAYELQGHFTSALRGTINDFNSAYYLTFADERWLNMRLDIVSNLLVMVAGISMVALRTTINPSVSGLVFSYMLAIVQMVQFLVRQMVEVENSMNSTERLHYYGTNLAQEPLNDDETSLESSWPVHGQITFANVQMRYRDNLPLVLKDLDMSIAGGERVAIIGRTGAGKSSIANVLFRLTELSSGSITIDGIDISTLALHDLRSRFSIVPQDPALFQGTVRSNLDPFNEYSDLKLWSALRQVHLLADTEDANGISRTFGVHLDSSVEEDGLNFSLGQRQLLALARVLVRDSRIVICDEATSSIDLEMDERIQETIRSSLQGRTLLCIAHRLKTVVNYDRVCAMDAGQVAEMGTPVELWRRGGMFREMCEQSGIVYGDL